MVTRLLCFTVYAGLLFATGCGEQVPRNPIGEAYVNPPAALATGRYNRVEILLNGNSLSDNNWTLVNGEKNVISGSLVQKGHKNKGMLIFRCLPPGSAESDWVAVVENTDNQFVGQVKRDGTVEFSVSRKLPAGKFDVRCYHFIVNEVTGEAEQIYVAKGQIEIVAGGEKGVRNRL